MKTETLRSFTVSTLGLRAGDRLFTLGHDVRAVASIERRADNLGAALITFTDGYVFHAGTRDAWAILRVGE